MGSYYLSLKTCRILFRFFDPRYSSIIRSDNRFLLNVLIYAWIFILLVACVNRFWAGMGIFGTFIIVWMVANRLKVALRHEAVLSTDLQIAGGGQAGNVGSFIPRPYRQLIWKAFFLIGAVWIFAALVRLLLGAGKLVWFEKTSIHITIRIIAFAVPLLCLGLFSAGLSAVGSPAYRFAKSFGDQPILWDTVADAQQNGTVVSFLRLSTTKAIERPKGYSQAAMRKINEKYSKTAKAINATRSAQMTDTTIIGVLSESFSDPTRVPGIHIDGGDPIPSIRALKNQTTSGYMLSSGYGGGTANLEYQELTGLSTTVFNSSTVSPYLQLVPHQKRAFSFNQMWNIADFGSSSIPRSSSAKKAVGSIAIHPYSSGMYQRRTNFMQKFLFRSFYTLDGPQYMRHTATLDRSAYVSDQQAYEEALERIKTDSSAKQMFVQLTTMQNHLPFNGQWNNNQFTVKSTTGKPLSDQETLSVTTAAKGFNITDKTTADWLAELDKLSRPITVVWYGDHLPGIYDHAINDPSDRLLLHETDYFIWSNAAARAKGAAVKLPESATRYTSPNYLLTLAACHMNAKVSPYMAFLTRMQEQIPAMEPALSGSDWSQNAGISSNTYLDANGRKINPSTMTAEQKRLLSDYRSIAYDMTLGGHYLEKEGFTLLPR